MEDILRKLGMETFISKFTEEKIYPGIVGKLSKYELTSLGLTHSADMMKLRVECVKHGNAEIVGAGTSFKKEYNISEDILEHLMEAGFSVKDMASLLSISESTIYRRMRVYGIGIRKYTDIDDDDLDITMSQLVAEFPKCGEQMLRNLLFVRGVKITRSRLRESIHRIDSDGIVERTKNRLQRRVYNVQAPNHLWHVDTNHKLIRWNFIIAGGIDGFSRFVVFLKCSNNNKAETIYNCFRIGVDEYGTPLKVRSDQGMENYKIAEYMTETRGLSNAGMITGKSTHNQRIERLWRDVFDGVLSFFYDLFYFLEDSGSLDPINDLHLYALHYVFMNRINHNLEMWRSAWNQHRIRTVKTSPVCLFTAGLVNNPVPQVDDFELSNPEEDVSQEVDQRPSLFPPDFGLPHTCQQDLVSQCPNDMESSNYGIDVYEKAKSIIERHL